MDNFQIRVVSEGREHFNKALRMAFDHRKTATHYFIRRDADNKAYSLTFLWTESKEIGVMPLPYPMEFEAASDFAWHWLENGADFGNEPDHDGDNGRGFIIHNGDAWGQIENFEWKSLVQIQPYWAMYGK